MHYRTLAALVSWLAVACLGAGPAWAEGGDGDIEALLTGRCASAAAALHDASMAHLQCMLAKVGDFDKEGASDVEVAAQAMQACTARQAPVRVVFASCAGDKLDTIMSHYESFALGYMVRALVRGTEIETAKTTRDEVVIADGPAFEALVDHLSCMSLAVFVAAEKQSDQDAAVAEAAEQCQRTAAVLDEAIGANFKPGQVERARRYAGIEAATQAVMEFQARHGAAGEVDGKALAAGDPEAMDRMLAQRCGSSMGQLSQAILAHSQCGVAKIRELGDDARSDAEVAGLAFAACVGEQAPIRRVLGQCAGDAAGQAMQSYLSFARNDLVKVQVRGTQEAVARTAQVPAMPAQGPVFDALVDHLTCVSFAGYEAAKKLKDRAATLAEADKACAASAKTLAGAAHANLSAEDAAFELAYARTAAAGEAGREFDARTGAAAKTAEAPADQDGKAH